MATQKTKLKEQTDNDSALPKAVAGNKLVSLPKNSADPGANLQPHPCAECRSEKKMLIDGPCRGHAKIGGVSPNPSDAPASTAAATTQQNTAPNLSITQGNAKTDHVDPLQAQEINDELSPSYKTPRLTFTIPRHTKLRLSAEQEQLLQLLEIALGRKISDKDISVVNDTLVINMHDSKGFQRLILIDDKELQLTNQSPHKQARLLQQLAMFNSFVADLGQQAKSYQAAIKGGVLIVNIANPNHYQDFVALLAGKNEATENASQQRTTHRTPTALLTKPRPSFAGTGSK